MKKELAEALVELLSTEFQDAKIYENYSGRGMNGKTTTGIELTNSESSLLTAVLKNLAFVEILFHEHEVDRDSIEPFQIDNLGLGLILY